MMGGVHHLAIQVRDLVAAERFYCGVLGLPVVRRWPAPEGGERSLWVGTCASADGGGSARGALPVGTFLALEVVPSDQPTASEDPSRATRPGHHLLALGIRRDERPRWEATLAAVGIAITARTDFTIYFCDPEGNRLGLSHYPEAADVP